MLATLRDDTWNVLNKQHIIPNSKRWDYSDIPGGGHKQIKGPTHTIEGGHHLRKALNPHPLMRPERIFIIFQMPLTVPLHICLLLGLCKETVKESILRGIPASWRNHIPHYGILPWHNMPQAHIDPLWPEHTYIFELGPDQVRFVTCLAPRHNLQQCCNITFEPLEHVALKYNWK